MSDGFLFQYYVADRCAIKLVYIFTPVARVGESLAVEDPLGDG